MPDFVDRKIALLVPVGVQGLGYRVGLVFSFPQRQDEILRSWLVAATQLEFGWAIEEKTYRIRRAPPICCGKVPSLFKPRQHHLTRMVSGEKSRGAKEARTFSITMPSIKPDSFRRSGLAESPLLLIGLAERLFVELFNFAADFNR